MIDNVNQIGLASPMCPSPRLTFSNEGLKPMCKVAVFTRALVLWFVGHNKFGHGNKAGCLPLSVFHVWKPYQSEQLHATPLQPASSCMLSSLLTFHKVVIIVQTTYTDNQTFLISYNIIPSS